jgi:hypothetical protein
MSRMGLSFDDAPRRCVASMPKSYPNERSAGFLDGSPRLSGREEGDCSGDIDGRFAEMRVQRSFQASEIVGVVVEDTRLVKAFHGSSAKKVVAHIFAKDGGPEKDPFRI